MCLHIFMKEQESHELNFVQNAKCLTDPPCTLDSLLGQQRRWQNSRFFNDVYFVKNFLRVLKSNKEKKSWLTRLGNLVLCLIIVFQLVIQTSSMGIFVNLTIFLGHNQNSVISKVFTYSQLGLLLVLAITASVLTRKKFVGVSWCVIFINILLVLATSINKQFEQKDQATIHTTEKDNAVSSSMLGITLKSLLTLIFLSPFLLFPRAAFCSKEFKHYFLGLASFIVMVPFYELVVIIYSFVNLDDLSWGNRPNSNFLVQTAN